MDKPVKDEKIKVYNIIQPNERISYAKYESDVTEGDNTKQNSSPPLKSFFHSFFLVLLDCPAESIIHSLEE
jgi:hypothetical protein